MMSFESFNKAEYLEKEGKKDEAISSYTDFITQSHSSQSQCGECHSDSDSHSHFCKEETYNNDADSDTLHEKLALAHNNRGFLHYLKVDFRLAVQDYTAALSYNPNMAVALYNRGLIHYRLSRFSEAVNDLTKAVAFKPDLEPAQMCLKQARKDFEQSQLQS